MWKFQDVLKIVKSLDVFLSLRWLCRIIEMQRRIFFWRWCYSAEHLNVMCCFSVIKVVPQDCGSSKMFLSTIGGAAGLQKLLRFFTVS